MIGCEFIPDTGTWVVDLGGEVEEFSDAEAAKNRASEKIAAVLADRKAAYGDFRDMARRLANGWSTILGHEVEPHEVMLCMANLKLARLEITPDHGDSKLDRAAYLTMAVQLLSEKSGKV